MGKRLFLQGVNIFDDPLLVRGLASKPFDAEGQPAKRLNLVSDGALETWLLDGRSGHKLGLSSNARAARSTSGQPSPSPTNLWLEAGTQSIEDLIRDAGDGVLITSMFTSGVNMVTGDLSRGASGLRIENGEITYPVSEITIAGNLKDVFAGLIPANDLDLKSSISAPTCLVEGLTVAGA
jgi:PmbA protein